MSEAKEISKYKMLRHRDLSELQARLSESASLGEILDAAWVERVHVAIENLSHDYTFEDNSFHLFRLLQDEGALLQRLDLAITTLEPLARIQNKLRPFKETLAKLKSKEENQIDGAVFELVSLGNLCSLCEKGKYEILLYPTVGVGKSNIEAKINVDNRWCNIEAKLFGYSPNDVSPQVDVFVRDPQQAIDRVKCAIQAKAGAAIQLANISSDQPSVLFMVPGYDPGFAFMEDSIKEAFASTGGMPSAVVQYGFHFRQLPKLRLNLHANCPLTEREIKVLKSLV